MYTSLNGSSLEIIYNKKNKNRIPAPPEGLDFLGKGVQTPSLSFQTVRAV